MRINRIIKTLVYHDLVLFFGWGLVAPILAVFVIENIEGGTVEVAGIASGVYWVFKSVIQIPLGRYLDKKDGEKDDYYFLVGGSLLAGIASFGFVLATLPWHLYCIQVIYAIGMATAVPGWGRIFTRHIDRGKEAQSWAWDSSALGIGAGVGGVIGGMIAKSFGFNLLFVAMGALGILSAILCFFIKEELLSKNSFQGE